MGQETKQPRILVEDHKDLMRQLKDAVEKKAKIEKETGELVLGRKILLQEEIKRIGGLLYIQYGVTSVHFMIYESVQCGPEQILNTGDREPSRK